ncbi:MAG: FAD-dependent oxidoreductase [Balneolaceae bacterium]|nr:FAD-dependent oxidoreductase [Balneolaceae bacterium]MCH8548939.1 FAD-binding oxidoreductase [Balneolaceae bacterium]
MGDSVSFWEEEAWFNPADLLIVGGGIVGASTALFYKERHPDHDVVIVERGFAPMGASTRNAGFTCIGSMSEHLSDMERSGRETVYGRIERRWNGLNLLKDQMGAEAMEYEQTGGYEIFTDRALYEECADSVSEMNRELSERLGISGIYSVTTFEGYPAIFNKVEGAIHSGRMMRSLHKKIAKKGVRVLWNTEVESAEPGRILVGGGREIRANKIALAVNGFASKLTNLPVKPARGVVMITEPVPELPWRGTFHHNRGYVYFRNVGDRLLIGGARDLAAEEETTDQFGINPKIRDYLVRFMDETLKLPSNRKIAMEWSGIMGMTENKEPLITEIESGVYAAAGLSGMGIAIGMQVARELTLVIG